MKKLISILLDFGSYVPYNAKIAKALGSPESAILLSVLMNRFNFYSENGKIDMEGFFYCTAETLESISAIGGRPQETAIKCLVNNKLIIKKVKGLPAKTHYKFPENLETCLDDLLNKFAQNEETCKSEKNKLDSAKCGTNDNINNDKEKDINNIEGEKTPPTIENVNFETSEQKAYREMTEHLYEPEIVENNLPLEEKKEKEKKVAAKKEKKEKIDNRKYLIEVFPNEESFAAAWGFKYGAKYPNIDASKAYAKLEYWSENKRAIGDATGKKADWLCTAKVWYEKEESAAKRSTWEITEKSQTTASKMQAAYDRLTKTYEGPF